MTMLRALRSGLATLVVTALIAAAVLTLPAGAHTTLLRASPDRDATAGGAIAFIDLEFLDPVSDVSMVVAYNGTPLAGRIPVPDGEVITFALDRPLTQPGRYQVSYEMISFDGDFTTGGYFFTFDPVADQVDRIEPTAPGGLSPVVIALSGVGVIVVVAMLAMFVRRIDDRRQEQLADELG